MTFGNIGFTFNSRIMTFGNIGCILKYIESYGFWLTEETGWIISIYT